jgi:hypothetical protein
MISSFVAIAENCVPKRQLSRNRKHRRFDHPWRKAGRLVYEFVDLQIAIVRDSALL